MALGDWLLLGVGRAEDVEVAGIEYHIAFELESLGGGAVACVIIHHLRQLPPDQRWCASLSEPLSPSDVWVSTYKWMYLDYNVSNLELPRVSQYLLWQAKHALAAGRNHGRRLSYTIRSIVERAEDISPIMFPPRPRLQQLSNTFSWLAVYGAGHGRG
jgi:hypothetical protein